MTRNEFIEKLAMELSTRVSAGMIADLLEDFNAHFDEALEAGKSEEAVCESLGDPAEIAALCSGSEPWEGEWGPAAQEAAPCRNLAIKLDSWNIICAPWDAEKFRITVLFQNKAAADPRIHIEEKDDTLYITKLPDSGFLWIKRFFPDNAKQTLQVDIPRSFTGELCAATGYGNINVSQLALEGQLSAQTSVGNVSVSGVSSAEKLVCRTSTGNIHINSCSGTGDFHANTGNIHVGEHRGTLGARTDVGNLHLETNALTEETRFETGCGNLHVSAALLSAGLVLKSGVGNIVFQIRDLRANITGHSGCGNIRGVLSAGAKARFKLHTTQFGSKIHNDFEEDGLPEDLPIVDLKTGSGNLRIEKA